MSGSIRFDEQPFQIDAINAVADAFEGQYPADGQKLLTLQAKLAQDDSLLADMTQDFTVKGNSLQLSGKMLTDNTRNIQERNGIEMPPESDTARYGQNYTVEMETGTGKTYVYVRSALELARRYGWRKFMIIVPSIAIKEGVANSIETMREHLESEYDDVGYFNVGTYDSKNVGAIGDYARSDDIEILIATIDSFNKTGNHMNREQEALGWQKPIDILANVHPVVIIDEPQSKMSSVKSKEALALLKPLITLRYSATHRKGEYYNLMYQLGPVKAHQQNLVKTVYVKSAGLEGASAKPYIKLLAVRTRPSGSPQAKLGYNKRVDGAVKPHTQWHNDGTVLEDVSENDAYRGYVVDGISAREGSEHIKLEGIADEMYVGESIGGFNDDLMKAQIKATIETHLQKERMLKGQGIKVLSLFFVDKVASYWETDDSGSYSPGKIQKWFVEELKLVLQSPRYADLYRDFEIKDLYDAYFSVLRKAKRADTIVEEDSVSSGDYKKAEAEAFERIMKNKQGLLDINNPLRFIFSHSALKEGWDNPNVFQICMMRDANSPLDRRQTIGRGLRLPVQSIKGEYIRSFDPKINQLTVIANESYEEFAAGLQKDYVSDGVVFGKIRTNAFAQLADIATGKDLGLNRSKQIWQQLVDAGMLTATGELTSSFKPNVMGFELGVSTEFKDYEEDIVTTMNDYELKNIIKKDDPVKVKFSKQILANDDFNALWDKINKRTTYRVSFDTDQLVQRAAEQVANMPAVQEVRVVIKEGKMQYTQGGIDGADVGGNPTASVVEVTEVPDIIGFLQRETNLTRNTIAQILVRSGRLDDLLKNPTEFKFGALKSILAITKTIQIKNVTYQLVPGRDIVPYRALEEELEKELIAQMERLYKVQRTDRTFSDYIPTDSGVERTFAKRLDDNPSVEVFIKLPNKFLIPTPFGNYNPDWAYVYNEDDKRKIYLVRETKGTANFNELEREREKAKIQAAQKHFELLNVDYRMVSDSSPLYDGKAGQREAYGGADLVN